MAGKYFKTTDTTLKNENAIALHLVHDLAKAPQKTNL